jgi:dihydroorotate dehydrogenase (fumarate)
MPPPKLTIDPPLLNTACPWATTRHDLLALYASKSTGALTTRTCLIEGFAHDDSVHQFLFFDPANPATSIKPALQFHDAKSAGDLLATDEEKTTLKGSLNSLGYSPYKLEDYEEMLLDLQSKFSHQELKKTVIVSVTGPPSDVRICYDRIASRMRLSTFHLPLAVEINLSCPNIPNSPPPAYDQASLEKYLAALPPDPEIPIGLKTPPYTYEGQFQALISALKSAPGKISFLTATNTLGSCMILSSSNEVVLPRPGLGGMAGPSLHPLALGNVLTLRRMLDCEGELSHIDIIGVGGVCDAGGFERMRAAGAMAVGVASALGREGVRVFDRILDCRKTS